MIIKLKTVEEALETAKEQLRKTRGYSDKTLSTISENRLLDYIPKDYFGTEQIVNNQVVEAGETWYYIGVENWGINSRFVEKIIENKE